MRVGILGLSGFVGQNYLHLLQDHPSFDITFIPARHELDAVDIAKQHCDLIFSALPADVAATLDSKYAKAGLIVISSSSSYRKDLDVPVIIPEINPEHLEILDLQKRLRGFEKGCIISKPNCSLQSFLIPLFPLHKQFGLKKVSVVTMQAVSGAGRKGVSSLEILDNIVPFIPNEEEKSESEPLKILGDCTKHGIHQLQGVEISTQCMRVPVLNGHTAAVSVSFENTPSREEIIKCWESFSPEYNLPSSPENVIHYRNEMDRPQPRLDRDEGRGMTVSVGRLRECSVLDYKFVALSHNAIRGAAGGGILIAELIDRVLHDKKEPRIRLTSKAISVC